MDVRLNVSIQKFLVFLPRRFFKVSVFAATLCSLGLAADAQTSAPRAGSAKSGSASVHWLPAPSLTTGAKPSTPGARIITATPVDALAGVAVTADYILGPEDQISIASASHPEVTMPSLKISADGKINLPLLGAFSVTGKTIAQLEKEVLRSMEREGFLRATATVTLQGTRVQRVFVLNASGGAGTVDIRPGWRVSDVLAMAGGTGNLRPELTDASLSRPASRIPIKLDLPSIMRDSNHRANLPVRNGDTIRLTARTIQISVAGKIMRSGVLDVPIGSTLTEVVALAGGVADKAALSRSTLKRAADGKIIPINFHDILVKGHPEPQIELNDGDLLLIPEAQEQVTIQGGVNRPGYFAIEDGKTLRISELIALAGGTRPESSLTRTSIQHADGTTRIIDLYKVLALNDKENNIELQPDDIVTVPLYTERVVVAGAGVRTGGFYGIEEGVSLRILDALTKAGGLASEPESTKIIITRGMPGAVPTLTPETVPATPETLTVDAVKLYKENDVSENIVLKNGDLIMVTSTPRFVYLAGAIRTPGALELREGEGLIELLARAGGVTEDGLAGGVVIERNGTKQTVDVFAALTQGDTLDVPVFPGDNIVIPINMNRVLVMPGVGRPGYVHIPEDRPLTVTEAIMLAGGPHPQSKLDDTVLLRQTDQGMTRTEMPLKNSDQWVKASKTLLASGDIIFIPEYEPKRPNIGQRLLSVFPFFRMFGLPFP